MLIGTVGSIVQEECEFFRFASTVLIRILLLALSLPKGLNILPDLVATRVQCFFLGEGKWWSSSRHFVVMTSVRSRVYGGRLACMMSTMNDVHWDDARYSVGSDPLS